MQPAIAPVAPGSVFSRRASSDVASAASAMLRAISASPPRRAWKSMRASVASHALGSRVPVQSNSSQEALAQPVRDRHRMQVVLAVAAAHRGTPNPSARTAICGSCRHTSRRRSARMSSGTCAGPCAPSTSTGTPAAWHTATIRRSGSTSALAEVMWSITASRRARRQRRCDIGDDRIGVRMRERHVGFHHARAGAFGDEADRVAHRAVAMAQHHDLDRPARDAANAARRCSRSSHCRRMRCPCHRRR